MNRHNKILLIVALATTGCILTTQANPLMYSVSPSWGPYTGFFFYPEIDTSYPTLRVEECPCLDGGTCYRPLTDSGYIFTLTSVMQLPLEGLWVADTNGVNGLFDRTFVDTTSTHEAWHRTYAKALADATLGKLESWSHDYVGNCFHTQAEALAAGNLDMLNALANARTAFNTDWPTDIMFEKAVGSYCYIEDINGTKTWRSVNENWGNVAVNLFGIMQTAIEYANSVTVSFTISPGDCICIPESSSWAMLVIGLAFLLAHAWCRGLVKRSK